MRVRVTFSFNPATGQVEEFLIDDLDGDPGNPDHDRTHDRIARDIGGALDRRPAVRQVDPLTAHAGDQRSAEVEPDADAYRDSWRESVRREVE